MAKARTKAEMVTLIEERHAALEAELARVDDAAMTEPGVTGEWSLKDTQAHITAWEQWLLRLLRDEAEPVAQLRSMRGEAGQALVDQMNAATFAANRDRALAEVRAAFDASYRETLQVLAALPDDALARRERVVGGNTWDHYDEHIGLIHAWSVGHAAHG